MSRRVVIDDSIGPATLVIGNGNFLSIEDYGRHDAIDLGEAAILPGLVDPHVHLNEPGRTDWEGIASGTRAAAACGITALCDMPLNSSPVTTTLAALQLKQQAAENQLSVDLGFHAGLIPGNARELPALLDAGVLGVKAFLCHSGIDEFPNAEERDLLTAMPMLAERGVPLLAHAELAVPMPPLRDARSYAEYVASRPPSFEREAIALMIRLCRQTRCPVHIVHLADAGSLPMLSAARKDGLPITVETCPHYLTFYSETIPDGATQYKCAPPIRDRANCEGLWQGLADGVIDLIASDHSPCPPSLKSIDEGRFDQAWGGISSLQLGLPVIWTEASRRGFALTDVARWMSRQPARLLGLNRTIAVGRPADFVVFDPEAAWTIDGNALYHRHKLTPYQDRHVIGKVLQTWIRGERTKLGHGRLVQGREED